MQTSPFFYFRVHAWLIIGTEWSDSSALDLVICAIEIPKYQLLWHCFQQDLRGLVKLNDIKRNLLNCNSKKFNSHTRQEFHQQNDVDYISFSQMNRQSSKFIKAINSHQTSSCFPVYKNQSKSKSKCESTDYILMFGKCSFKLYVIDIKIM